MMNNTLRKIMGLVRFRVEGFGRKATVFVFTGFNILLLFPLLLRAEEGEKIQNYIQQVERAEEGMTLWEVLQSGGIIMIILGLLSVFMYALIVFLFIGLSKKKLLPSDFRHDLLEDLRERNFVEARQISLQADNIISSVGLAGLDAVEAGHSNVHEIVESAARKEIASLWASIHYLTDIASIAPMLGLLGTVIGMIQAFNTIAFQSAVVKPILLAGGVSKAMVTTAGGMTIAIIAMIFYSYFRFKVQNITDAAEEVTVELADVLNAEKRIKGTA